MNDRLTAYIAGRRVGWFEGTGRETAFRFDDDWRRSARRLELSLSLPKSRREHHGDAPANFLWNLLPDNEMVLQRWGALFGVSARNPMALLAHVGLDTAGAVQLTPGEGGPVVEEPGGLDPIDDARLAEHLRALRKAPESWLIPGHDGGYFSLAGAQSKFALSATPSGWAVPTGGAASTHIVKPGILGLDHGALNEHLTMRAATLLGLDAAASRIVHFEDEAAIVVARYDRLITADGTERIHQEDLAQARGVHPGRKYQADGGPGIAAIADTLRRARGRDAADGVLRFFDAVLFNWVSLGTDAHAKNYSLLHDGARGPRLAPLYDLTSALPYPSFHPRTTRLAMSIGGHYRVHEIEPRHLIREAELIGLNAETTHERADALAAGLPEAYAAAASENELDGPSAAFAATLIDAAAERSRIVRAQLDRHRG